jgi:hypothetical protein
VKHRTLTAAALALLATALFAPDAAAQAAATPTPTRSSLGEQGQMILGAERVLSLFEFQSFKTTATVNNITASDSSSGTAISFFSFNPTGPIGGNGGGIGVPTFFTIPRLGFDYVVIPNLTVGGSVTLVLPLGAGHTTTQSNNGQNITNTTDGATTTLFGLAPRAGYVIALSEMFAIWPRGGLSFYSATLKLPPATQGNTTSQDSFTITQWALNAEGLFVFTPFPHVGITAGLALDVPLTGSYKHDRTEGNTTTTTNADATMWHVGINAGMIVYF